MNTIEIDYEDFVENLFQNPPKDEKSIVLTLDTENLKELFEKLLSIFHRGSIYFHGDDYDKVDLDKLEYGDFVNLNQYFRSFGINLNFKIIREEDLNLFKEYVLGKKDMLEYSETSDVKYCQDLTMNDVIKYDQINSPYLEDYRINLKTNSDNYVLWFKIF